ncbi:phage terminase large subunit family protein [Caballeronia sp. LZ033]|uniref:terminase gpA endonuclease subunit n=1 Tax=Caballeronia sp. LZ033 TaxID=3038566 RepID=UPI002863A28B|nr:terminase gpA endonuclease subunit [Caballeronia sp. LZ033]MDR5813328.1 phage terminase large subunit family protein [Caballeronia sp. LZ033]
MIEAAYARAGAIASKALEGLVPPKRISVAEYALDHRRLQNEGGGYVGKWTHDITPYLVEPMECVTSLDYLTTAVVGPGQSGKTEIAQNWLLKSVANDPGDILWYMQTDPGLEAYVKGRINPMIDLHHEMRENLGRRPIDDSIHFKRFRGMKVEFLSATYSNLINKSAPRIVADEIDAYPDNLGDIKALLDIRRQTFGRQSMILAVSHPDLARGINPDKDWTAGVMAIYGDSDRRVWYWRCPHCGAWSSPAPTAERYMTLHYPEDGTLDEIEAQTRLLCPVSGCLIEDSERREMNRTGRWIGRGQTISQDGVVTGELVRTKTAGFWILGVMSPFVLGGIGALARARVKAERELEVSGDDNTLRQVMVKQWGIPYSPPRALGSVDANDLADRAERETPLQVVPEGVRFMTCVADCQLSHFEWLVRGWGEHGESWIIDRGRLPADPAASPEDWDKLLTDVFMQTYPLADGSGRRMGMRGSGYDSAGQPGVAQQAYAAWTRWRRERAARLFGKIGGRDVWSIIPTKGGTSINGPKLNVVYPDTSRAANKRANAGTVPIASFNPNLFKDDLVGQLRCGETGAWYVHFPHALRSKEQPHAWFEQIVSEHKLPTGRWEKINPSARNEALDLMVMSHVVAHLHGLSRIDWAKPPSWAAPWDRNSLVSDPPKVVEAELVTVDGAPPAPAAETPRAAAVKSTTEPGQRKKSLISRMA